MLKIPISCISLNPEQPRRVFDPEELAELCESIKQHGVLQPVIVESTGRPESYILLDGHRRLLASRMAGLSEIPAVIRETSGESKERLLIAMVANLQRSDLRPIEEASGYARLRDEFGLSAQEIARDVGKSGQYIANRLALLTIDKPIQELIDSGKLPGDKRVIQALKSVQHTTARVKLAAGAADRGMTIKGIVAAAHRLNIAMTKPKESAESTPSLEMAMHQASRQCSQQRWDALQEVGQVPPWTVVVKASKSVCDNCVLRADASTEVCQACPAPAMLKEMIELAARE